MPKFDQETYAALRAFLPGFMAANPFARFGAHGVGIGRRRHGGKQTDELCLRIYLACKLPLDQIPVERRVPPSVRVVTPESRRTVDVPTDVVVMPAPSLAMPDPGGTFRPVPGGVSCSAPSFFGAGTIGGWVLDKTDETVVMLSNAHVFGPTAGAEIIQPGTADGGDSGADRIGSVKRSIAFKPAPLNPTPADCNFVDAAIGMVDDPDLIDLTVLEIGPAIYAIEAAAEGMAVRKYGQTTELTNGTVIDTDYNTIFNQPINGVSTPAVFCDLILVENMDGPAGFASQGDSGSILFRPDPDSVIDPAVGLIFATTGSAGVACKIQNVFDALDLDVLCASGYPAYLDGIAEGADPDPGVAATRFTEAERRTRAAGRRKAGLARDVQRRLRASVAGQAMVDFLDMHRHEILMALIRNGDVRRAVTAALEPLLRTALTSKDVLAHRLDEEDVKRIGRVADCVSAEGSKALQRDFARLKLTRPGVTAQTVATVLGLD